MGAAVVALADGLAVALADDCGNGVGSYPNDVQAASAATANAVNVAATGRSGAHLYSSMRWASRRRPSHTRENCNAVGALVRPLSLPSAVTIFLARCCSGRAFTLYCLTLRREILFPLGWFGSSRSPYRQLSESGVA